MTDFPNATGIYDNKTVAAVAAFQHGHSLNVTLFGRLDMSTALLLLKLHACDGYRDAGRSASSYGPQFLYKVLISVHANRSIETNATLFDKVCVCVCVCVCDNARKCLSGQPSPVFATQVIYSYRDSICDHFHAGQ